MPEDSFAELSWTSSATPLDSFDQQMPSSAMLFMLLYACLVFILQGATYAFVTYQEQHGLTPNVSTNLTHAKSSHGISIHVTNHPGPTCNLGDEFIGVNRQYVSSHLSPRAPDDKKVKKQQLRNPKDDSDGQFDRFMKSYVGKDQQLYIVPRPSEYNSWKINFKGKRTPIGATGVWHDFTDRSQNFIMQGLTGCTAIIIVSSRGIWAGHLWEGSKKVNGPGSFTYKFGEGRNDWREREPDEFQALAVDIFGTATPDNAKARRPLWKSLVDLRQDNGNPFADGSDTEIFLLTKAVSDQDRGQKYPAKIDQLQSKFLQLIPGASYEERTYADEDPAVAKRIRGLVVAQYSPYDHNGGPKDCTPMARVRIFYENNKQPIIDKSWPATNAKYSSRRKRDACERTDPWPIKQGYVAFGDSFAAGMGTGKTTTDSCRVGSANIGDLIYAYTNESSIDYQRKMCSGDTTTGLNRQINGWKNPAKADIGTITMGGNDVGFSDIVKNCVLSAPWPWHWSNYYAPKCKVAKAKAIRMMQDSSEKGIGPKLTTAYKKILTKSTRKDFHLYVSGYPSGFFNTEDLQPVDCKNSEFNYFHPGYCPSVVCENHSSDNVYLSTTVRKELNSLVVQLNNVISAAVDKANSGLASPQVHFVDVGPYFNGHRWCEKMKDPHTHEPNEDRDDTWFFLSGWKDIDFGSRLNEFPAITGSFAALTGHQDNTTSDSLETAALIETGKISLPPAGTCSSDLGTDPDPWAVWLCDISQSVVADPKGFWGNALKQATEEIQAKNFTGQSIHWFLPTRTIKTFHPRTPGMLAYRDSIVAKIREVQMK